MDLVLGGPVVGSSAGGRSSTVGLLLVLPVCPLLVVGVGWCGLRVCGLLTFPLHLCILWNRGWLLLFAPSCSVVPESVARSLLDVGGTVVQVGPCSRTLLAWTVDRLSGRKLARIDGVRVLCCYRRPVVSR